MPLHRKIVWLFVVVAVVPLLVVAEVNRRESLYLIRQTTKATLSGHAHQGARLLASEAASADEALRLIAALGAEGVVSDSLRPDAFLDISRGSEGPSFETLGVLGPSGVVLARSGPPPAETTRCTDQGLSTLVRREVPLGPAGQRVVGTYWAGHSLGPEDRDGLSAVDAEGRVVWSFDCGVRAEALAPFIGTEGRAGGSIAFPGEPGRYGAYAPVAGSQWVAVATAVDPRVSASMWRVLLSYWVVVLGVVASTALTYILVGRVTSSLEVLTQAAERVGAGNLRPWLPPPGSDEVGRLTLAFSQMMSRLRDTMEQADRSGRLAVVGKLSSYLAHEIRNPLSAVKMNLQRLERWTRSGEIPERCREPVELSLREVDRLSTAVSNVLQLSRSHDQPAEVVSVHDLVKEAGSLLDTQFLRQGVALRWELDAEADRIVGRRGQLKGVILNLMLNALDAQPEGGELLIRSNLAAGHHAQGGPHLELRFLDQGDGVPQGIRERIFEPFFTTKRTGSGIGLAIAGRAVRDHGGDLRLEDPMEVGEGAEFVVSLPLAAVSPEEGVTISRPRLASWMEDSEPGTETIEDRVAVD